MKIIQVYDPPLCCSTGICGPDVDPEIVAFAAMLSQLAGQGVQVERYNLSKEPMAFVQNPVVKALLESDGEKALPLVLWDGKVEVKGRYPSKDERLLWFRAAKRSSTEAAS